MRQRGPVAADLHSDSPSLSPEATISTVHSESLPPLDHNKEVASEISPLSPIQTSGLTSLIQQNDAWTTDVSSANVTSVFLSKTSKEPPSEGVPVLPVGDNQGSGSENHSSEDETCHPEDHGATLRLVLAELQDIKSQLSEFQSIKSQMSSQTAKLDKIETSTASLAKDIADVIGRTGKLETSVSDNKVKLKGLDKDISSLTTAINAQKESLSKVNAWKEEVIKSNSKSVSQINDLVRKQQKQVDLFHENSNNLKQAMLAEVDGKMKQAQQEQAADIQNESKRNKLSAEMDKKVQELKQEAHCNSLKTQAYNNRFKLVVMGMEEDEGKTPLELVKDHFSKSLKIKNISIAAYRVGSPTDSSTDSSSSYSRPIMVRFNNLVHRNRVWRKRAVVSSENGTSKIKIQADLPKPLREGMQVMYRVLRAATKIPEYASANINDYQLEINRKVYQVTDLEDLPKRIRPSTLLSPKSDTTMVFFSRHSFLSNHHPSGFKVGKNSFQSMEQFLAFSKASIAGKPDLISKALKAQDPVQAKRILNALKQEPVPELEEKVATIAMEGLRAKFKQNRSLKDKLCQTHHLTLGEASVNERWGIGLDINHPDALNQDKWTTSGNLLGRALMEVRQELMAKNGQSAN